MLRIRITIAHTHTLAKSSRPRFRTFYGTTRGFVGSALKGSTADGRICQHENWFPCKFPYLPMLTKYRQSANSAQSKLADIDDSRTIVEKYEPWWEKCHQTGPWIDCWWARRWEGSGGGGGSRWIQEAASGFCKTTQVHDVTSPTGHLALRSVW